MSLDLTPDTILLMNATIIAGLLILLTIQITNFPTREDLVQQFRTIEIEENALKNLATNETNPNLKTKIEDRLNDLTIERESARAQLTALTYTSYLIYTRTNFWVLSAALILPFIISSILLFIDKTAGKMNNEKYIPKKSIFASKVGFYFLGFYFIYQIFPIGRFLTGEFFFP